MYTDECPVGRSSVEHLPGETPEFTFSDPADPSAGPAVGMAINKAFLLKDSI